MNQPEPEELLATIAQHCADYGMSGPRDSLENVLSFIEHIAAEAGYPKGKLPSFAPATSSVVFEYHGQKFYEGEEVEILSGSAQEWHCGWTVKEMHYDGRVVVQKGTHIGGMKPESIRKKHNAAKPAPALQAELVDGDMIKRAEWLLEAHGCRAIYEREDVEPVARAFLALARATAHDGEEERAAADRQELDWQPISTAPKDGTWMLTWRNGIINQTRWQGEITGGGMAWGGKGWQYPDWSLPTHWMPLPEPPALAPDAPEEKT